MANDFNDSGFPPMPGEQQQGWDVSGQVKFNKLERGEGIIFPIHPNHWDLMKNKKWLPGMEMGMELFGPGVKVKLLVMPMEPTTDRPLIRGVITRVKEEKVDVDEKQGA